MPVIRVQLRHVSLGHARPAYRNRRTSRGSWEGGGRDRMSSSARVDWRRSRVPAVRERKALHAARSSREATCALGNRMSDKPRYESPIDALLAEQIAYYRAVAPEYESLSLPGWGGSEVAAALAAFRPTGDVLELACGPGIWTELLLQHATALTA